MPTPTPTLPDRQFDAGLRALQAFVAREGHAWVPGGHVEGALQLGCWVYTRRHEQRRGTLDPARRARLDAFPGWTWDAFESRFEAGFEILQAFVAREGHANVPAKHHEGAFQLGRWVGHRRLDRVVGRLRPHHARRLEGLPGWTWNALVTRFETGFAVLEAFVAREGHARVPNMHQEGPFALSGWVRARCLDRAAGRLAPADAARFEALPGWTWTPDPPSSGIQIREDVAVRALEAFIARERHAQVSLDHEEGGFRLGSWVSSRRLMHRRGTLRAELTARLEALPAWTWNSCDQRNPEAAMLAALQLFIDREGHNRVSSAHREGAVKLGRWVESVRQKQAQGTIDPILRAQIEAIPGWTWTGLKPRLHRRSVARPSRRVATVLDNTPF